MYSYSYKNYLSKLSGPLLDRIDINVNVKPIEYESFRIKEKAEKSKDIKARVEKAIKIQRDRYKGLNILYNSELTPKLIEEFLQIG